MRLVVSSLAARGITLQAMKDVLHPRVFRSVPGRFEGDEDVRAAFLDADPRIDIGRFYFEHPMYEDGQTWIMTRMWGRDTEPSLALLCDTFHEAQVTFRRAE